jgi:NADPH-dependent 2,4-dienoyl-CoA reductase/sulfur reductase-like enzyme
LAGFVILGLDVRDPGAAGTGLDTSARIVAGEGWMMTGQPEHVIVVGAGLGGLRTAQQLRSAGFQGRISLVGAERHPPYDRPPLSKQLLTLGWDPERIVLAELDALDEIGVRVHLGLPAVALRPGGGVGRPAHELELADGSTLHGDAIVVATGLTARKLPGQPDEMLTLRTVEDALALRDTLGRVGSLLIVGGGFIGAEVASCATDEGLPVIMLEALPVPFGRALGPELGALAARNFSGGVDLRTGVTITGFTDVPDGVGVELADGTVVRAEAGLVGVGGVPCIDWMPPEVVERVAAGGLHCSPTGRVHGLRGVWAVGDVSAWDDPEHGVPHRHEHWTSAGDQAAAVAHDILGAPPPLPAVPYFWSDQFGLKIQVIGRPEVADADHVMPLHGTGLDGGDVRGTVAGYLEGERLVAVAGFGAARYVSRYRPLVAAGASADEAKALAASL